MRRCAGAPPTFSSTAASATTPQLANSSGPAVSPPIRDHLGDARRPGSQRRTIVSRCRSGTTRTRTQGCGHTDLEDDMQDYTIEIVECPECAAPAEIVDRFVLESTIRPDRARDRTVRPTASLHRTGGASGGPTPCGLGIGPRYCGANVRVGRSHAPPSDRRCGLGSKRVCRLRSGALCEPADTERAPCSPAVSGDRRYPCHGGHRPRPPPVPSAAHTLDAARGLRAPAHGRGRPRCARAHHLGTRQLRSAYPWQEDLVLRGRATLRSCRGRGFGAPGRVQRRRPRAAGSCRDRRSGHGRDRRPSGDVAAGRSNGGSPLRTFVVAHMPRRASRAELDEAVRAPTSAFG